MQPINLKEYPEQCDVCGQPARTELVTEPYPVGVEWFQFCTNPKCIQYDAWIRQKEEIEIAKVRESAVFKRHQDRLWIQEIRRMNRQQRKLRTSVNQLTQQT